jgi:hypothetical protein
MVYRKLFFLRDRRSSKILRKQRFLDEASAFFRASPGGLVIRTGPADPRDWHDVCDRAVDFRLFDIQNRLLRCRPGLFQLSPATVPRQAQEQDFPRDRSEFLPPSCRILFMFPSPLCVETGRGLPLSATVR